MHAIMVSESNEWISLIRRDMNTANLEYEPCIKENCSCHMSVINHDLTPFREGITHDMFLSAQAKATKYQARPFFTVEE